MTSEKVTINTLAFLVVLSALSVTITKGLHRIAFIEHDELQQQNNQLQVEWGRLQLEYSAFRSDAYIEMSARSQLGMEYPKDIVGVEVR